MTLPLWFNPLSVLTVIAIIILAFAVYGTTSDRINEGLNRDLVNIAIEQNNKQLAESKNIEKILQAQGNLSQDARDKIVRNIIENNEVTIPQINNALGNISEVIQNLSQRLDHFPENTNTKVTDINQTVTDIEGNLTQLDNLTNPRNNGTT